MEYNIINYSKPLIFKLNLNWEIKNINKDFARLFNIEYLDLNFFSLFENEIKIADIKDISSSTFILKFKSEFNINKIYCFGFEEFENEIFAIGTIHLENEIFIDRLFFRNIVHDLKNPIQVILGFSKIIKKKTSDILNDEQKKIINYIENSAQFLENLTNKISEISIIESNDFELVYETSNLAITINKSISNNIEYAKTKNISIEFENSYNEINLDYDTSRIEDVLNYLINNSIKFSKFNSNIEIKLIKETNNIIISIKDNGYGIETTDSSSVFRYFSKVNSKNYSGEYGNRLNLAISKRIIYKHNGSIWFENSENNGCVFFISLPIKQHN